MTQFKLSSPVAPSLMLAVSLFVPTTVGALPVAPTAETDAGPTTPGVASLPTSGPEISLAGTTSGCVGSRSRTTDGGRPSTDDEQRAASGSLSSTVQPIPGECPPTDDHGFWGDVYRQIAQQCSSPPDLVIIREIECEEVGDGVYTFRAEATCLRFV